MKNESLRRLAPANRKHVEHGARLVSLRQQIDFQSPQLILRAVHTENKILANVIFQDFNFEQCSVSGLCLSSGRTLNSQICPRASDYMSRKLNSKQECAAILTS
jgi:hypothetical protein